MGGWSRDWGGLPAVRVHVPGRPVLRRDGPVAEGQISDLGRQLAGREIPERHRLEHRPDAGADRHPDVDQRPRRADVVELADAGIVEIDEGALHRPEHVRERDVGGGPAELVTALGAPAAAYQLGMLQLRQDHLQERERYALHRRDVLCLDRRPTVFLSEHRHAPERVVSLR